MKNLSKLKSRDEKIRRFVGRYPRRMELANILSEWFRTQKISWGSMPLHPTRTLHLRCSFSGNRSIFILNPRLGLPRPVGILNLVGLNETFGLPEVLTPQSQFFSLSQIL